MNNEPDRDTISPLPPQDILAAAEALDEFNETGTPPEAYRYAELLGEDKPFSVNSDRRAGWAIRQIAEARAEHIRMTALIREEIEILKVKLADEDKCLGRETTWLTAQLETYFDTVPQKTTKTMAKYRLPSGALARKQGGMDFPRDDQQIIQWARAARRDEFVKTKEELRWADLKKQIIIGDDGVYILDPETGVVAIIPGLSVVQKPDTFIVETEVWP